MSREEDMLAAELSTSSRHLPFLLTNKPDLCESPSSKGVRQSPGKCFCASWHLGSKQFTVPLLMTVAFSACYRQGGRSECGDEAQMRHCRDGRIGAGCRGCGCPTAARPTTVQGDV